jgi:hypothetical protein
MTPRITKNMIIDAMKKHYAETGNIPSSTNFVFDRKVVAKRFGGWNAALTESDIPIRMHKPMDVICLQCGTTFKRQVAQVKKSPNHFCSHSCSAKYSNKGRIISDAQKAKTSISFKRKRGVDYSKPCMVCQKVFIDKRRKTCSSNCLKICKSSK